MAVLYSVLLFAFSVVTTATSFVITNEDPVLPIQQLHDEISFVRILPNNETEIIECPPGTYIDKADFTCQFKNLEVGTTAIAEPVKCLGRIGDFKNSDNCRTFVSCGVSGTYLVRCPETLVYNEATGKCDYPKQGSCCEFTEYDSNRLVQNSA